MWRSCVVAILVGLGLQGCEEKKEELKGDHNCDLFVTELCKSWGPQLKDNPDLRESAAPKMCKDGKHNELSHICLNKCPESKGAVHAKCLGECIMKVADGKIKKMTRFDGCSDEVTKHQGVSLGNALELSAQSGPTQTDAVPKPAAKTGPTGAASKGAVPEAQTDPSSKGPGDGKTVSEASESHGTEPTSKGPEESKTVPEGHTPDPANKILDESKAVSETQAKDSASKDPENGKAVPETQSKASTSKDPAEGKAVLGTHSTEPTGQSGPSKEPESSTEPATKAADTDAAATGRQPTHLAEVRPTADVQVQAKPAGHADNPVDRKSVV